MCLIFRFFDFTNSSVQCDQQLNFKTLSKVFSTSIHYSFMLVVLVDNPKIVAIHCPLPINFHQLYSQFHLYLIHIQLNCLIFILAICMLVAVILFPVKFTNNFPFNAHFDFEWAYGLSWAAMCFILTAAILFLISLDTKEIYHAEKRLSL